VLCVVDCVSMVAKESVAKKRLHGFRGEYTKRRFRPAVRCWKSGHLMVSGQGMFQGLQAVSTYRTMRGGNIR